MTDERNDGTAEDSMQGDLPVVRDWLTSFHNTTQENRRLRETIHEYECKLASQDQQIAYLKQSLTDTSARADYYQRLSVELNTLFTSFGAAILEAQKTYRYAPYRPNGVVPKASAEDPASAAEPAPAFLTRSLEEPR